MAFSRPTLDEIYNRMITDIEARLPSTGGLLQRSVLKVLARVYAGAVHLLYGYLEWISEQIFAVTSDIENLEQIADEYGITRRPAGKASGTTAATGTNGTAIPLGTELQDGDGIKYLTTAAATIAGGTADLSVQASIGDADSNADAGTILSFVSPIAGVDIATTVDASGLTGGSDQESDESLRDRVLTRKRQPPHGGIANDYITWMLENTGVTRAWALETYQGAGTLGLGFVYDESTPIFPNEAQRTAMLTYITSHTDPSTGDTVGAPVTAVPGITMLDLGPLSVNFSIQIEPNNSTVQAAVTGQLEALLERDGGPNETLRRSDIWTAIDLAPGLSHFDLISPAADVAASSNQVHQLGTITYGNYL